MHHADFIPSDISGDGVEREIFLLFQSSPRHTGSPACKTCTACGACDPDEERTECSAMLWSGVTTWPGRRNSTMPFLSRWAVSPGFRTLGAGWPTRPMAGVSVVRN